MSVVAPEVGNELCIFVESQKHANYLDGEHFRVKERGSRSACSEASEILGSVVDEAEDGIVKVLRSVRRPPLRRSVWSLPSVGRSSLWFKPSRKRAHGVS